MDQPLTKKTIVHFHNGPLPEQHIFFVALTHFWSHQNYMKAIGKPLSQSYDSSGNTSGQ